MHWQNLDRPAFLKKIVNYLGNKFFFCEITFWNYWTRHPRSTLILRSICILLKRVNKMPLIFLAWQDDTGKQWRIYVHCMELNGKTIMIIVRNLACQVRLFSISAAVGEKKGELSEMYTLKLSFWDTHRLSLHPNCKTAVFKLKGNL